MMGDGIGFNFIMAAVNVRENVRNKDKKQKKNAKKRWMDGESTKKIHLQIDG